MNGQSSQIQQTPWAQYNLTPIEVRVWMNNSPSSQILQCPLVPYPTMHNSEQKCNVTHFCSEWCILGYGAGALWNLWDWSIASHSFKGIQVHLFMQEHEKRKPWRVIIPRKYQLTIIYTKCWLSLSHWDESILLSYHICIKSQQLMSRITNVRGT